MPDHYNENKPLYGSSGIDTYLKLIAQKYPFVDINELLEHAEMKPYQVQDQGHLFSQRQINRFYKKLVESGKVVGSRELAAQENPLPEDLMWHTHQAISCTAV